MAGVLDEQRHSARAALQIERRYAKRRINAQSAAGGSAYQAIVDTARRLKADMIIMTTHSRTGMSHLSWAASPSASCAARPVRYLPSGWQSAARRPNGRDRSFVDCGELSNC
jgi:hypothetical protein